MKSTPGSGKRNFHVPLPPALYADLRAEAHRQERPATVVVREAIAVDLRPRSGSEQTGRRPAVVVSHDGFNLTDAWWSIVIVPISSSPRAFRPGPTVALLDRGTAGLRRASAALCHQITTVDRAGLTERIGALPLPDLARVEDGIRAALDLD